MYIYIYILSITLISLSIYSMHVNKLPKFIDVVKCLEEFKLKEKRGDL